MIDKSSKASAYGCVLGGLIADICGANVSTPQGEGDSSSILSSMKMDNKDQRRPSSNGELILVSLNSLNAIKPNDDSILQQMKCDIYENWFDTYPENVGSDLIFSKLN